MVTDKKLVQLASDSRAMAHAPYSGFGVGAALLCEDGAVYTGCNVENATYGATCCAERIAIFKAVSEGKKRFSKIAVVGGRFGEEPTSFFFPCGICRQVLSEFCGPDFTVLVSDGKETKSFLLSELLPCSFSADAMI